MLKNLLDYQIMALLGESMHAEIYKAHLKNEPQHMVVIKKIKPQFCHQDLQNYLQQQINHLTELHLPHCIIPIVKHLSHQQLCLIQPWVPGKTLTQTLSEQSSFDLDYLLTIICAIAAQIEERHQAGFIHKSIKPSNILILPDAITIQIIDDIRILDINQISHFIYQHSFKTHTLPYISPEQTGRIKQDVNYSTDLYSLGMVLCECLTGKAPFLFDDPLAIIHSHLAELPCSIDSINKNIPKIIGKIARILLQKAPEKRYQTAAGLIYDLNICLQQWQENRQIDKFTLKQKDYSNRITIPSLLVGRDAQKQQLLQKHAESCAGHFRAAFISGLSGIGKTRLIQELQLPIVAHSAYFTSGKFDQFKKHIPYSTLIQAWSNLVKTFLTEDKARIHYWQRRISKQLGEQAQLIIDLVPELQLIIGEQPEVKELPPVESRNRFNDVAGKFLSCLASQEHPLTIFIDDLQWCDGATFDFLERVFNNHNDYKYIYLIGAYRHNEVDKSHRLTYLIQKVKTATIPLTEIQLKALTVNDVNQMTAYILNTYPARTKALSELIYNTSAGNPLFVNESLRWLHNYRHLHLSNNGVWTWDNIQLSHAEIPNSALDLFKDKITKLTPKTRDLLAIAACLGANFAAQELALVAKLSLPELYKILNEAFVNNILLKEQERLFFFHDQVQAAAESFMNTQQKQQVHKKIAQALIKTIPNHADLSKLNNIFSIVEHLFASRTEQQSAIDRKQEAEFNYYAGIAAMHALAMENANFFFRQSQLLFPDPDWNKHYQFLFKLYKYLARTEMALGNQPASEKILNTLIAESKNDLDRIDCLYEQTTGLSSMGNFTEAIKLGNRGLSFFARQIPNNDAIALQRSEKIMHEIHHNEEDVWQEILDIVPSGNRATKIETGIYSELIPDYYLAGMVPQLYLSAIQSTQNCLAGGVDESVIYGFSMVGLYLQRQGQYSMSFRYEDLGLALAERYPDTFGATKGINGILWTNMHNRRDSEYIIDQCRANIHRGKNCGDLYNAGLSYGPYIWHLIHQGSDLESISAIATECIQFSKKFNLSLSQGLAESAIAGWVDTMVTGKETYTTQELANKIQNWDDKKHVVSIGGYYTLKGISCHYLGNYAQASAYLELAKPFLRGLSDNILNRLWYVFRYVNSLRLYADTETTMPTKEQAIITDCMDKVSTWATLGPILKPYLAFMQMEHMFMSHHFSDTRHLCLDAIDTAEEMNFVLLAAYLAERLAQLLLAHQHSQADYFFKQALTAYHQCSAFVKEQQLINDYGLSLNENLSEYEPTLTQQLDVNYLLQATRSITQQLDLKPLLSTILQSVMQRLGAKSAFLLIVREDTLHLVAKGIKQDSITIQLADEHNIDSKDLSYAISHYVQHTAKLLVLDNAMQSGDFIADTTVQQQQLKSILCVPLILKKQVLGVLYLENKLIASVFTADQVELTQVLTAQAAITLQNTLLVQKMQCSEQAIKALNKNLEQRVEQRTADLNKANTELTNFAYVVSHDLKAPLRAINQLAGWISEDYASTFDDAGKQQMQLLQDRAKRMHEMIDGILQYSRIGRLKEIKEPIDMTTLIQDVIQLLAPDTTIKISLIGQFPIINAEKVQVFQVFQNLIDNAIKYNDKPIGKIEVSCTQQGTDWQFCIADNGPGIDSQYQQKIFQLFQTLKPKDQSNSTGIGLSLVEKIIHNWQGKIWIESDGKQGCKFLFTLPMQ